MQKFPLFDKRKIYKQSEKDDYMKETMRWGILLSIFLIQPMAFLFSDTPYTPAYTSYDFEETETYSNSYPPNQIKLRMAAFLPTQGIFRSLYGNAIPTYEIEATQMVLGNIQGWSNFNWLSKKGHASGVKNHTHIKMANLSMGFNWVHFWNSNLMSYLGIGASLSRISVYDRTLCGRDTEYTYAVGGIAKSGIQYYFMGNIFAEGFVDFLYLPVTYEEDRNLGGFRIGGGLGMNF